MKKLLFITLLLTYPSLLLSKHYCMYIDQFDITKKNESKIHSILKDIAYPSTLVQGDQILIYSGKFKSFADASKLLPLTKSRYKHAKVASCDNAKRYKGGSVFQSKSKKQEKIVQKHTLKKEKDASYFCLNIFEAPLHTSALQKNKINYILQRVPQATTKVKENHLFILSGNFTTKESASTIAKVLQREFPNTKVQKCQADGAAPKSTPKKPSPSVKTDNDTIQTAHNEFSILSLNTKGFLDKEIASSYNRKKDTNIQKSDIRHALDTQREEHFNGLYLKANTAFDIQNNDPAYDIRLEFDLFDQGYYENKKKNEKYRVDNQINFYRTVKNIEILKKEQELLKIKKYENALHVSALLLQLRVQEENLQHATLKLQKGLITQYEYDSYTLALQELKDELLLFKNMTLLKIPRDLWKLLNQIEHTHLLTQEQLLSALGEGSIDLKLVQTLQERKPLAEEWSDKLRVNFYAGVRKMYLSQNQTLLGVEAKIPLSNYSRTAQLDQIQSDIMSQQVRLQHAKSREILKDAIATYKYKQQKIKTYSYELARIQKHLQDLELISKSSFASYANISSTNTQKVQNTYLSKYTQTQLARLGAYKELVHIMYLIHTTEIKDVLSYGVF